MRSAHAIGDRAGPVPAAEHGLDGPLQLLFRRLGEGLARLLLDDRLVALAQLLELRGRDVGVGADRGAELGLVELVVEGLGLQAEHDAPVHGDEAAVAVVGEALVGGGLGQPLDALVVQAEVEDRVHHPGHRELRPRAHRDEQRVRRVAEPATHLLLEGGDVLGHLLVQARGPAAAHVGATGVGGDGEPGGDGQLEHARHLGEVGALAPQEVLHLHRRTAVLAIEGVDVRHVDRAY